MGDVRGRNSHGRVVGRNGAALTHDDTLLYDASREFGSEPHTVLEQLWLGRPTAAGARLAVIAANFGHVYYHRILDVLPRLELLRLGGYHLGEFDNIIVNPVVSSVQTESLATLGVESWIAPDPRQRGFHIVADQLVLPSTVGESGVPGLGVGGFPRRASQHDLGSQRQRLRRRMPARPVLQPGALLSAQGDLDTVAQLGDQGTEALVGEADDGVECHAEDGNGSCPPLLAFLHSISHGLHRQSLPFSDRCGPFCRPSRPDARLDRGRFVRSPAGGTVCSTPSSGGRVAIRRGSRWPPKYPDL